MDHRCRIVWIVDRQTLSMVETTILDESDEERLTTSQHFPIECKIHNVASETESRVTDVNVAIKIAQHFSDILTE